jgi:hypothetical protein
MLLARVLRLRPAAVPCNRCIGVRWASGDADVPATTSPVSTWKLPRDAELDAARREVAAHKTGELIASLRPCVQAVRATDEVPGDCRLVSDALPLGASRLGGYPDMPADMDWPSFDGKALAFVAQVNLAEMRADIERAGAGGWLGARELPVVGVPERQQAEWHASLLASLPRSGWLLLFLQYPSCRTSYTRDDDAHDAPHRSLCGLRYVRDVPASALRRRGGPPAGVERLRRFGAHPLAFMPALTAPLDHPDDDVSRVLSEAHFADWPHGVPLPGRDGWRLMDDDRVMRCLSLGPDSSFQVPLAELGLQLLGHSVDVQDNDATWLFPGHRPLLHISTLDDVAFYTPHAVDVLRPLRWPAYPELGLPEVVEDPHHWFVMWDDGGSIHVVVPAEDLQLDRDGHWRVDRYRAHHDAV